MEESVALLLLTVSAATIHTHTLTRLRYCERWLYIAYPSSEGPQSRIFVTYFGPCRDVKELVPPPRERAIVPLERSENGHSFKSIFLETWILFVAPKF
eukprot:scaffold3576_cov83-Skeletonema_menzelii.AAC.1